jgi:hypothetical protein
MEKVLAGAAHLPLHSQKLILKAMGDSISSFGEGRCNIFGGSSSCVAIPSDSDYVKQCPDANKKVDCALRMAAFEHIAKDPEIHFQEKMSSEGMLFIVFGIFFFIRKDFLSYQFAYDT